MAPSFYLTDPAMGSTLARRDGVASCIGWHCLSDAAQLGVILIIISTIALLGFLYWRFQIKPQTLPRRRTVRVSNNSWEVARTGPNRVTVTLHRRGRAQARQRGEEVGNMGRRTRRGRRNSDRSIHTGEDVHQSTGQTGHAGTQDIHLIPPPPPPVVWAAPPPFAVPPPPVFGPQHFSVAGPPQAPLVSNPPGLNPAAVPSPEDAPPAYFGQHVPQDLHPQEPAPGTFQPAGWSTPLGNRANITAQQAPRARDQRPRRRWFSLSALFSRTGRARTLPDSGAETTTRSMSPSPIPPSVSTSTSDRGPSSDRLGRHVLHSSSTRQSRQSRWRNAREDREDEHETDSTSEPELEFRSINTSTEAVHGSYESSSSERHMHHDRRSAARVGPSDPVRLSTLSRQRSPSPDPRERPSSDIQFPTPESCRARVSFVPPRDSDDVSASGEQNQSSRRSSQGQHAQPNSSSGDAARRRPRHSRDEDWDEPDRASERPAQIRDTLQGDD